MNNDYKNLTEWCAEYSKKSGVKIYPQSAPLQLVLEDVVGQLKALALINDHLMYRVQQLEEILINKAGDAVKKKNRSKTEVNK